MKKYCKLYKLQTSFLTDATIKNFTFLLKYKVIFIRITYKKFINEIFNLHIEQLLNIF